MPTTGAGPRVLARIFPLLEVRRALFCMFCSGVFVLYGCETLPVAAADAAATPVQGDDLALQAEQAYQGGDWLAAENAYRRMVVSAPENAENWFRLGNAYAQMNMYGEAVRMYGEALKRNPDHLDAWHNLGMAQMQLAARSFVQLQARAPADDPARDRARRMVDGVTGVLKSEQVITQESPP